MKIVFMGSSDASSTCLKALLREKEFDIAGVVTQPDRQAGRGKVLTPCPCKAFAMGHGIKNIITPENINSPEAVAQLEKWDPDVIAVVAFGQFLGAKILNLPLLGCINCHFSLLPKYRGASPVTAAIAAGDKMTGVTIMRMGAGMDDGPILMQSYEPIYSDATGGELMEGLAVTGGVTLAKTLKLMNRNALPTEIPQNPKDATFAGKLKKSDGEIRWEDPVIAIDRKVRAYNPWPGTFTFLPERFRKKGNTGRLIVLSAEIVGQMEPSWKTALPGTILKCATAPLPGSLRRGTGPVVKCADTALMLTSVKPEGGMPMDGRAFLCGRQLIPGETLG